MSSHFGGKEQKPAEASSNGGKFIWKKKKKKTLSEDKIQKMSWIKVVFLYFSVCLSLIVLSD